MICRSNNNTVIDSIRKLLFNYDLQITRVKSELALRQETMDFAVDNDNSLYQRNKIEYDNYKLFLVRLEQQKRQLIEKLNEVAKKYEGEYSEVFALFYFEHKDFKEIAEILGISEKKVMWLVHRYEKDLVHFKLKKGTD